MYVRMVWIFLNQTIAAFHLPKLSPASFQLTPSQPLPDAPPPQPSDQACKKNLPTVSQIFYKHSNIDPLNDSIS